MKCSFYILLALLLLLALGYWVYDKYVNQAKIEADIYLGNMFIDKKIYYKVDYSGLKFSGAYDLNSKEVQNQDKGKFRIRTVKSGMNFGLELLKNNKVIKSLTFDLLNQKLNIKA